MQLLTGSNVFAGMYLSGAIGVKVFTLTPITPDTRALPPAAIADIMWA